MEIRKGVGTWWRLEREWWHEEIGKGVGTWWRLEREWGHGGD